MYVKHRWMLYHSGEFYYCLPPYSYFPSIVSVYFRLDLTDEFGQEVFNSDLETSYYFLY